MKIQNLRQEAQKLRDDRAKVSKQLKNEQRKNKRLKERAKHLTEDDMVAILSMKRAKKNQGGSSSSAGGATSVGSCSGGSVASGQNLPSEPRGGREEGAGHDADPEEGDSM